MRGAGRYFSFLRMCCEPVCLLSNFTHCEVYPVQIWPGVFCILRIWWINMEEQGTDHSNLAFTLSGRKIYYSNFQRREFEHFLCFYYNFFLENTRRLDERGCCKCKRDLHYLTSSAFIIFSFIILLLWFVVSGQWRLNLLMLAFGSTLALKLKLG